MSEQPSKPVTMIHCDTCGEASVYGQRHKCSLSARQLRKLAAHRAQQAAEAAKRTAPRPCQDCGQLATPGIGHYCSGRPVDKALAAASAFQIGGVVSALKAAGYDVVKRQD